MQRHCSIACQGAPAFDGCASIQGDAGARQNIALKRRRCAESRGAPNLPKHIRVSQTIAENNRRVACGRERATYLKNEDRIGVPSVVERSFPVS
jgi:hypothetical protein